MRPQGSFSEGHNLKGSAFCLSVNYATNCGIYVATGLKAMTDRGFAALELMQMDLAADAR